MAAALTVAGYLKSLAPNDRRTVSALRDLLRANLADGFVETASWGMVTYEVPRELATATYDGEPLVYAAVGAEKRACALHLTVLYNDSPAEADFRARWRSPSRRMVELGTGVVRFRSLKDLDLDLIAEVVASMTVEEFIESFRREKS